MLVNDPILNLTIEKATREQLLHGVVEPSLTIKRKIVELLSIDRKLTYNQVNERVLKLVEVCDEFADEVFGVKKPPRRIKVLIGGPSFLVYLLTEALYNRGYQPVFSFQKRVTQRITLADGRVIKTIVFKPVGFIEIPYEG